MVKRYRVRRDGGTGGSNATGASHRALIHAGWCGGMSEEAARVSGVCPPPHGGRRRRHLEEGNGRVGSTRRGSCRGSGPDVAPKCSYGLTYHNRVDRSTAQSPSVQSQRARFRGQTLQGLAGRGAWGGSNATRASHRALIHAGCCARMSEEAARVSGVCPLTRTAPPPAPGGGKRTRRAYTEGILLWVWPGCCSKVFVWADLT